jgi:NADH-quinone oxidoreductase subunit N
MAAFYIVGVSLYLSWTNFNANLSNLSYNNLIDLSGIYNVKKISSLTTYLNPEITLSLFFILMYFFFKLGAGPFYTWVVDVYNSSSTGVLFVVSVIPKLVYIPILGFLLFFNFIKFYSYWSLLLFIIGFSTLFIGSFGILMTDKLKEIYSWSSMIHTGNLLLMLSCVNKISITLIFFYLIGYSIISCGFLLLILTL